MGNQGLSRRFKSKLCRAFLSERKQRRIQGPVKHSWLNYFREKAPSSPSQIFKQGPKDASDKTVPNLDCLDITEHQNNEALGPVGKVYSIHNKESLQHWPSPPPFNPSCFGNRKSSRQKQNTAKVLGIFFIICLSDEVLVLCSNYCSKCSKPINLQDPLISSVS